MRCERLSMKLCSWGAMPCSGQLGVSMQTATHALGGADEGHVGWAVDLPRLVHGVAADGVVHLVGLRDDEVALVLLLLLGVEGLLQLVGDALSVLLANLAPGIVLAEDAGGAHGEG